MEGKLDPRVKRTQQLLGKALISLALEKDYDAITIKEITERAEVAYITFFRNFDSKDTLLSKMMEGVIEEIEGISESGEHDPSDPLRHEAEGLLAFRHARDNRDFYRILLTNPGTAVARNRIKNTLALGIQKHMEHHGEFGHTHKQFVPNEIAAHHIAASFLALIAWWLEHDMPYPPERMAQIYARLIVLPALEAALVDGV